MIEIDNVLSLFNGMSCGGLAFDKANIKISKYYSSEIEKHPIAVTQFNYPGTIQLGSVVDIDVSKLDKIDLLIGGSPCQSFSFAGKMKGMATKCEKEILTLEQYMELKAQNYEFEGQSYLFWEFVRILKEAKEINPNIMFLLENVVMIEKWEEIISETLGFYPIMINSALLSAQNRKRLYWTNIKGVEQPEDQGILLRDILENGVVDREKGYCIDANYWKGGNLKQYFEKSRRQLVFKEIPNPETAISTKNYLQWDVSGKGYNSQQDRAYFDDGKFGTLPACRTEGKVNVVCGALRGRYRENGVRVDGKKLTAGLTRQELELRTDGKTNTIASVQKDNVVVTEYPKYRKLTPIECERLQTVPDDFTKYGIYPNSGKKLIPNGARYKMLGNGWTIDVIAHIFKSIKNGIGNTNYIKQLELDI